MYNTIKIFVVAAAVSFGFAAQAQSASGQASVPAPTVLLPYGVSTVASVHTAQSGPVVSMPVREGVRSAPAPDSVPAAASATVTQTAPAPAN